MVLTTETAIVDKPAEAADDGHGSWRTRSTPH